MLRRTQDRNPRPTVTHQLRRWCVLAHAVNRLSRGMQRLEHDGEKITPQGSDYSSVENIRRKPWPQLAAQERKRRNVPLHLPAARNPPRKISFIRDDQNGRCFHLRASSSGFSTAKFRKCTLHGSQFFFCESGFHPGAPDTSNSG